MGYDIATAPLVAASTFMLTVKMFGSLAVIFAAAWAVMWAARRHGMAGSAVKRQLHVDNRVQLGRRTSAVLLSAGSRTLLLGVTEQGVTVLAEGDDLRTVEGADDAVMSHTSRSFTDSLRDALMSQMAKREQG